MLRRDGEVFRFGHRHGGKLLQRPSRQARKAETGGVGSRKARPDSSQKPVRLRALKPGFQPFKHGKGAFGRLSAVPWGAGIPPPAPWDRGRSPGRIPRSGGRPGRNAGCRFPPAHRRPAEPPRSAPGPAARRSGGTEMQLAHEAAFDMGGHVRQSHHAGLDDIRCQRRSRAETGWATAFCSSTRPAKASTRQHVGKSRQRGAFLVRRR